MVKPTAKNLIQFGRVEIQTIESDIHCRSCGYNLRGLLSDGQCPECAVNVATSLAPSGLSIDRRHGRFVKIGIWMIVLLAVWEILSKTAWILIELSVLSPALYQMVGFLAFNPGCPLFILLAQSVALFCFTAGSRSKFRMVLFGCLVVVIALAIPAWLGERSSRNINFFLEESLSIVLTAVWLGHAAAISRAGLNEALQDSLHSCEMYCPRSLRSASFAWSLAQTTCWRA